MRLAKDGQVEYVVIESSGISEPEQVAETFSVELVKAMLEGGAEMGTTEEEKKTLQELIEMGGLNQIAYLDTCVTIIDAFDINHNLHTADFLSDRAKKGGERVPDQDERTISDLFADQIEFADVILINKIDRVDDKMKKYARNLCKELNPDAKIIETSYSKVDFKEVINTGLYDYGKMAMGVGWLKSLHELTLRNVNGKMTLAPKPETEEYGISSCIYKARRPFHPKRLFHLLHDKFILLQNTEQYDDDSDDDGEDEGVEEAGEAEGVEEDVVSLTNKDTVTALPESTTTSDSENGSSKRSSETEASSIGVESSESAQDVDEDAGDGMVIKGDITEAVRPTQLSDKKYQD